MTTVTMLYPDKDDDPLALHHDKARHSPVFGDVLRSADTSPTRATGDLVGA